MHIPNVIFKVITSPLSILLVNTYLIVLIGFDLSSALTGQTRLELIELRGEDISDIIVTWAVLLESRELLLSRPADSPRPPKLFEGFLNSESARSGLILLSLGMLLQLVTYFDFDVQAKMFSLSLSATFNAVEWALMALIGGELLLNCLNICRIVSKRTA